MGEKKLEGEEREKTAKQAREREGRWQRGQERRRAATHKSMLKAVKFVVALLFCSHYNCRSLAPRAKA